MSAWKACLGAFFAIVYLRICGRAYCNGCVFDFAYNSQSFPVNPERIHPLQSSPCKLQPAHAQSIHINQYTRNKAKMKHVTLPLALFTIRLAHLITAQCPACDSYSAALRSCQKTSTNITAIGNTMDTSSVHCMCVSSSSATQMNTCQGCGDTNIDARILGSWYNTCKADGQYGDQQAIACWEAQPGSFLPCVSNTVGKGSGTTTGGFGVTTPSEATR